MKAFALCGHVFFNSRLTDGSLSAYVGTWYICQLLNCRFLWMRIYDVSTCMHVSTLGEQWDKQISPTRPMFMHLDIHFSFYYFWNVEFIKTWNVYNIYNPMRNCDFRHMTWWIDGLGLLCHPPTPLALPPSLSSEPSPFPFLIESILPLPFNLHKKNCQLITDAWIFPKIQWTYQFLSTYKMA